MAVVPRAVAAAAFVNKVQGFVIPVADEPADAQRLVAHAGIEGLLDAALLMA
jgi:hypothetical protein